MSITSYCTLAPQQYEKRGENENSRVSFFLGQCYVHPRNCYVHARPCYFHFFHVLPPLISVEIIQARVKIAKTWVELAKEWVEIAWTMSKCPFIRQILPSCLYL